MGKFLPPEDNVSENKGQFLGEPSTYFTPFEELPEQESKAARTVRNIAKIPTYAYQFVRSGGGLGDLIDLGLRKSHIPEYLMESAMERKNVPENIREQIRTQGAEQIYNIFNKPIATQEQARSEMESILGALLPKEAASYMTEYRPGDYWPETIFSTLPQVAVEAAGSGGLGLLLNPKFLGKQAIKHGAGTAGVQAGQALGEFAADTLGLDPEIMQTVGSYAGGYAASRLYKAITQGLMPSQLLSKLDEQDFEAQKAQDLATAEQTRDKALADAKQKHEDSIAALEEQRLASTELATGEKERGLKQTRETMEPQVQQAETQVRETGEVLPQKKTEQQAEKKKISQESQNRLDAYDRDIEKHKAEATKAGNEVSKRSKRQKGNTKKVSKALKRVPDKLENAVPYYDVNRIEQHVNPLREMVSNDELTVEKAMDAYRNINATFSRTPKGTPTWNILKPLQESLKSYIIETGGPDVVKPWERMNKETTAYKNLERGRKDFVQKNKRQASAALQNVVISPMEQHAIEQQASSAKKEATRINQEYKTQQNKIESDYKSNTAKIESEHKLNVNKAKREHAKTEKDIHATYEKTLKDIDKRTYKDFLADKYKQENAVQTLIRVAKGGVNSLGLGGLATAFGLFKKGSFTGAATSLAASLTGMAVNEAKSAREIMSRNPALMKEAVNIILESSKGDTIALANQVNKLGEHMRKSSSSNGELKDTYRANMGLIN